MAISCPFCETSLMGDVNRCWSCGRDLPPSLILGDTNGNGDDLPVEPPLDESSVDGVADVAAEDTTAIQSTGTAVEVPVDAATQSDAPIDLTALALETRTDGPFAPPVAGSLHATPSPAVYPRNVPNRVGAVLAVALGALALVQAHYFPIGAVCTSIVGMICGLWGIQSNRRLASTIGMGFCTIALFWGGLRFAVDLYIEQTNVNPFAPNIPAEESDEVEDDGGLSY